ncbi:hypothetical protein AMTRI_Chr02g260760 [Amborella trichopoda]
MGFSLFRKACPMLLFSCLFLFFGSCFGEDTISRGQSLTGNQTITSNGDNFVIGFFTPGNSQNWYIGIWYEKVSNQIVVWVANRDKPLTDNKSELKISEDGNLVLLNKTQLPIWSTNVTLSSTAAISTVAVLLDTGNLVLRGINSSEYIWQSMDHPTDTWLPGGKLGLNKKTNKSQLLTNWRNLVDPFPGPYSLELDPNGSSNSGDWNGNIFSGVPEIRLNNIYNFSFIGNENESYVTCSMYDNNSISRFVMYTSGQIKGDTCDVYGLCGPFGICRQSLPICVCLDGSQFGGCIRKTQLQCENNSPEIGQQDGFLKLTGMTLKSTNSISLRVGSAQMCESACLRNCSCTAYKYGRSCTFWMGNLLAASELANITRGGEKKRDRVNGVIAGLVAVFVGIIAVILELVYRCIYKSQRILKVHTGSLIPFCYRDLQSATKNFSEKLGGGGFGSVFKGTLPDKTIVAVKKLEGLRQGEKQFRMEVSTIGTIQHVNLVRLRGFCSEGARRLLVYDYMPNGSLDLLLFREGSTILDWKTRYEFALGTARGIAYLHEKCRDCIIHCDVKPENILLDGGFCPKVADFGLAKLLGREFSLVLTTMRGTRGYLAPEWISSLAITPKANVYSYGMTLLEMKMFSFFPTWAAKMIVEDRVLLLLDSKLEGDAGLVELTRACRVACWCIQDDENARPSIGQVLQFLEGVVEVTMPLVPMSLEVLDDNPENVNIFCDYEVLHDKL